LAGDGSRGAVASTPNARPTDPDVTGAVAWRTGIRIVWISAASVIRDHGKSMMAPVFSINAAAGGSAIKKLKIDNKTIKKHENTTTGNTVRSFPRPLRDPGKTMRRPPDPGAESVLSASGQSARRRSDESKSPPVGRFAVLLGRR
jgi:hypothetical protein